MDRHNNLAKEYHLWCRLSINGSYASSFNNHCLVWYYLANQIKKEVQNGHHEPGCTSGSEPGPARWSDRGVDGDSGGGESDRNLVSEFEHGFESHWGYF